MGIRELLHEAFLQEGLMPFPPLDPETAEERIAAVNEIMRDAALEALYGASHARFLLLLDLAGALDEAPDTEPTTPTEGTPT